MLLWKNHIEGIPNDVYKRLIENGFLIKETYIYKGYIWSDLSNEINQKFNKEFNYDEQ